MVLARSSCAAEARAQDQAPIPGEIIGDVIMHSQLDPLKKDSLDKSSPM
jgi:hypothetical protein